MICVKLCRKILFQQIYFEILSQNSHASKGQNRNLKRQSSHPFGMAPKIWKSRSKNQEILNKI